MKTLIMTLALTVTSLAGIPSYADEMTQAEMSSCIAQATRQGERGIAGPMLSIDSLRAYIARNPDCGQAPKIEERPAAVNPITAEMSDCVMRETNYYRGRMGLPNGSNTAIPSDPIFTAMLGSLSIIIAERCGVNDFTNDLAKKRAAR